MLYSHFKRFLLLGILNDVNFINVTFKIVKKSKLIFPFHFSIHVYINKV